MFFSSASGPSFFQFHPYVLEFKKPAQTSRDTLFFKRGFFLTVVQDSFTSWGEVSFIESLSIDNIHQLYNVLKKWQAATTIYPNLSDWLAYTAAEDLRSLPSLQAGMEMLIRNITNQSPSLYFSSDFTQGKINIPINGLVWMGNFAEMQAQIEHKISEGYACVKLKIGAITWEEECRLLSDLRSRYPADLLEIRVDANGAFTEQNIYSVMEKLNQLGIHSIEQPVAINQWELMRKVTALKAVPVALDEELIGRHTASEMVDVLDATQPDYIILKPSLIGGFFQADRWIDHAQQRNIDWWATSALESNLGLNAIAQWAALRGPEKTHGLGTGNLYKRNVHSPLRVFSGLLSYHQSLPGDIQESIVPLIDFHFSI